MQALKLGLVVGTLLMAAGAGRSEIKLDIVPPPVPRGTSAPPSTVKPDLTRGNPADFQDVLTFLDKDTLHGRLVGIDPSEYGLQWKHRQANAVINFALASVDQITLGSKGTQPAMPAMAAIYLTNGDVLQGKIVSMDEKCLVLDTWFAGQLRIERAMLKVISPQSSGGVAIYEGPNNLEEWAVKNYGNIEAAWQLKKGVLETTQGTIPIAKLLDKMPDKAEVQFEAAWNRNQSFSVYICMASELMENTEEGYMVQMSGGQIYLNRVGVRTGHMRVGQPAFIEEIQNGRTNRACFNLLIDKPNKSLTVLYNGRLIITWTDSAALTANGKYLGFQAHNRDLRLSNIRVAEWDGTMPQITAKKEEVKDDLIRFVNSDMVSGTLLSITDQNVKFQTAYATIDIPLARAREIVMSSTKAAKARRNQKDVRGFFTNQGSITFQLLKIEHETIQGESENFGKISAPLGAFRQINFNIYKERD